MSVDTRRKSDSVASSDGVSRYDALLMAIPLPIVAGGVHGLRSSGPAIPSVGVGAVVSAVLVWYALFVDAPVRTDD